MRKRISIVEQGHIQENETWKAVLKVRPANSRRWI